MGISEPRFLDSSGLRFPNIVLNRYGAYPSRTKGPADGDFFAGYSGSGRVDKQPWAWGKMPGSAFVRPIWSCPPPKNCQLGKRLSSTYAPAANPFTHTAQHRTIQQCHYGVPLPSPAQFAHPGCSPWHPTDAVPFCWIVCCTGLHPTIYILLFSVLPLRHGHRRRLPLCAAQFARIQSP